MFQGKRKTCIRSKLNYTFVVYYVICPTDETNTGLYVETRHGLDLQERSNITFLKLCAFRGLKKTFHIDGEKLAAPFTAG